MKRSAIAALFAVLPFLLSPALRLPAVAAGPPVVPGNGHSIHVCGIPAPQFARCSADVVTNSAGSPQASGAPLAGSYGPVQLHTAYNLPCTPGGPVRSICSSPKSFGGQTIAIVVAFNDPNIESDLGVYDQQFGLPTCTKANGCLSVVGERGSANNLPSQVYSDWSLEESLDVETAHATCQTCNILVVESNFNSFTDLMIAVNTAAKQGATEISNSWGEPEYDASVSSWDPYFNHPGVAIVAASGDSSYRYGAEYPASSKYVLSIGGTTLNLNPDNTYGSEAVWNGTDGTTGAGSGCSQVTPALTVQMAVPTWSQTGCGSYRATADVSADADPATGAAVYDSIGYGTQSGWFQVGGTSLASPLIAGVFALAGGIAGTATVRSVPYAQFNASNSHDIANGYTGDGQCNTSAEGNLGYAICHGIPGYDAPSGLGSPSGLGGF